MKRTSFKSENIFQEECDKDLAHKLMASKEGVYIILINIITKFEENPSICLAALKCMVSLMNGQPDLLRQEDTEIFTRLNIKNSKQIFNTIIDNFLKIYRLLDNQINEDIILETLRWISNCCIKHENNRQCIFKKNILRHLKTMMENHKNPLVIYLK